MKGLEVVFENFNKVKGEGRLGALNGAYEIPEEISSLVSLVSGLGTFSYSRWEVAAEAPTGVPALVTPQTIYDNYLGGVNPTTNFVGPRQGSQAVIEFGNLANYNPQDISGQYSDR